MPVLEMKLVDLSKSLRKGIERRLPRGHRFKDLTGRKFGQRKVLGFAGFKGNFAAWLCRCKCGQLAIVEGAYLANGTAGSCGCIMQLSPAAKKLKPPLASIKARFDYPSNPSYRYYGACGITVCKRWREFVEAFAADMGPRPSPKHVAARRNRNGNYTPSNCFWAYPQRESPRQITYDGETLSLTGWARRLGISREAMRLRVNRCKSLGLEATTAITATWEQGKSVLSK